MVLVRILAELARHIAPASTWLRTLHVMNVDDHNPICIAIGERIQQNVVDDAENRGGGADAERQRDNSERGEPGLITQAARRITHVAGEAHLLSDGKSSKKFPLVA